MSVSAPSTLLITCVVFSRHALNWGTALKPGEFRKTLINTCVYAWICRFFTPSLMPSLMSGWSGLTPLTMPGLRSWPLSVTTDCTIWSLFSLLWQMTNSSKLRSSLATPMPLTYQVCLRDQDSSSFHWYRYLENNALLTEVWVYSPGPWQSHGVA